MDKTHDSNLKSWIEVDENSDFPIQNIPFGVYSPKGGGDLHVATAIGNYILDLAYLDEAGYDFTKSIMYRTVCSDLSDLENVFYDILVFYSPSGIKSLYQNYPDFKQNNTRIAAFGPTTTKAVTDAGLTLNIKAPSKDNPSMTMAIEKYIKVVNKR